MKDYIVVCDSSVDLSEDYLKENNIPFIPFSFESEGTIYKDDLGISYPYDKFYQDIRDGKIFRTSQISSEEYKNFFEQFLKEGKDVLFVGFSSGLSGSFNSAYIASNELNEKYPNKIYPVDSLAASSGHGLLTILAKENKDRGMSIEENYKWLEDNKKRLIHWFMSSDLTSYVRGGRISKAAGFFGTALQICPVMCVSDQGKLEVLEKTRTKKKAIKQMVDNMFNEVGSDYDNYCFISGSDCFEDVKKTGEMVKELFPKIKDVKLFNIGSIIGSHAGPGTVALFYLGKKRAL